MAGQMEVLNRSLDGYFESLLDRQEVRTLVEIGCGGGILASWLASKLSGKGKVIGFDTDKASVRRAVNRAQRIGAKNLLFEVGDVCDLPLPDNFTDMTVCKSLLCVLNQIEDAVEGMYRITKPQGLVVAIEPASGQQAYDSQDQRFSFLSTRLNEAFIDGWRKKGADQTVGLKVPDLFLNAGLTDITAEAVTQVHLLCDPRRQRNDVLTQLKTEASHLSEQTRAMLLSGGISEGELEEFHASALKRLAYFSANPSEISKRGYVRVMSTMLIVTGRKTQE